MLITHYIKIRQKDQRCRLQKQCGKQYVFTLKWQGSHSDWKTWKTWKNGKAFSSQGKVREFWTDWKSQGKVRENHTKYWKTEINWDKYYLVFLVIFKWTVHFLVKWIKFSVKKKQNIKKNTGKMAKNTGKVREKSGNFVSLEKWEPWMNQLRKGIHSVIVASTRWHGLS